MFKKVFRNELSEGMRFSAPVFFDDGENMLLGKGVPLKSRELAALDRWKIPYVLTMGSVLADTQDDSSVDEPDELGELDEVDDAEEDHREPEGKESTAPAAKKTSPVPEETPAIDTLQYTSEQILKLPEVLEDHELYKAYRDLIQDLDAVFTDIKEQKQIRARSIDRIVSALFSVLQTDRSGIAGFILGGDIDDMELAKSSVNTAILSIIIGEHLGMPRHRLLQVATAALLHDVGMLKIPDAIVKKTTKLDESEMQQMRSHTFYGYKLIVNELMYADEVGKAAAQHHERWDGEGYPGRLVGANIDIGARIISAADAFEAMVSPKAWRDSMVGYQAMKSLLSDNARRFDPDIIKAMIQSIGIYPVGSIVLMNNSVIARVVETNKEAPLRPKIRVLIDEFAKPYTQNEGEYVNLMENRNIFIARAIDPAEYQKPR
jgi:HD-GYP domain-containing protein (c-di-GMP phosphodiesterase class II)